MKKTIRKKSAISSRFSIQNTTTKHSLPLPPMSSTFSLGSIIQWDINLIKKYKNNNHVMSLSYFNNNKWKRKQIYNDWVTEKEKKYFISRNKHGRNLIPLVSAWRRKKKGRGRMTLKLKKCGWRMEKGWTRFLGRKECGCLVWREEWFGNPRLNLFCFNLSLYYWFLFNPGMIWREEWGKICYKMRARLFCSNSSFFVYRFGFCWPEFLYCCSEIFFFC